LRTRSFVLAFIAIFCGAVGGAILAPQPASAVSREIIELQQQVSQLLQGQTDLRSAIDSNNATLRTLVQQSLDATNKLNDQMGAVQKSAQELQANTGSRIDTMTQQTQGIADNVQDVQARVGKLTQQLSDIQNELQSIDAKVSGGAGAPAGGMAAPAGQSSNPNMAPPPAPPAAPGTTQNQGGTPGPGAMNSDGATGMPARGMSPGGMAPISADTLYQNALRDFTSGNYDLAQQEFGDYIKNFPSNDLASNSQFYLGEIAYAQNDYKSAISAYDLVLTTYPHSFKLSASLYKKAIAETQLGERSAAIRDLRDVVRRFPGTDESRRAQAKLREMGATTTPHTTAR
jgi:tol-pal system protein YbgF